MLILFNKYSQFLSNFLFYNSSTKRKIVYFTKYLYNTENKINKKKKKINKIVQTNSKYINIEW